MIARRPAAEVEPFLRLMRKLQDDLAALTDLMITEAHGLTIESEAQTQRWLDKATLKRPELQQIEKWWDQPTRRP